jgi:hypothetical protein
MGIVACAVAAAAACSGANAFTGTDFGNGTGSVPQTGNIQGAVTADGAGLGGVSVILVGRDSVQTDGSGVFRFEGLAAATYPVTVRVPIGFALAAGQTGTQNVPVSSGGTATADFALQRTTGTP